MSKLSWGLIVCTYNRPRFLNQCLKYALNQSRKPSLVVIVDASDYWERTYQQLLTEFSEYWDEVGLIYEFARIRGTAHQRNQALERCDTDIVFSLDDDIYLHADAAEIIMSVYEKDGDEEVAMVGGLFAEGPPDCEIESDIRVVNYSNGSMRDRARSLIEDQLSLERHFVPYDYPYNYAALPSSLSELNVHPCGLLNGGRTTFRRRYGQATRWTSLLSYYATHDDSDFSYRVSKWGRVLVAPQAKLFHADGAEDRPNKFKVNLVRVCNLLALHRVNGKTRLRSAWRLLGSFSRFAMLYLVIDAARKRLSFPTTRAYILGIWLIPLYMFFPFQNFESWYRSKQQQWYEAK